MKQEDQVVKVENMEVTLLIIADKSDPLNLFTSMHAKASIDGVLCGWRASSVTQDKGKAIEEAAAILIRKILTRPHNPLELNQNEPPDATFVIHDDFPADV
jgi:hypothetical protein